MSCESSSICSPHTHTSAHLAERSRLHPHCWQDKSHKSLSVIMAQWRRYITWLPVSSLFMCQKSHCFDCHAHLEESSFISDRVNIMFNIFDSVCLFQLVAVFDVQHDRTDSPRETMSNGYSSAAPSPEPLHYYPHLEFQEPGTGEIEVNEAILKRSMSNCFPLHKVSASSHENIFK